MRWLVVLLGLVHDSFMYLVYAYLLKFFFILLQRLARRSFGQARSPCAYRCLAVRPDLYEVIITARIEVVLHLLNVCSLYSFSSCTGHQLLAFAEEA